ncbi:MAG: amidohydrolase family protein [Pseudomonadota bacterium]
MAKKYLVIDGQFHHLPFEAVQKLEKMSFQDEGGKRLQARLRDPAHNLAYKKIFDPEVALRHMEECGVDMALIQNVSWIVAGLEVCQAINNGYGRLAREYPGKFIPLAHVPYLEGQKAVDELDRAVTELGLKGVTVMTSQRGIRLHDQRLKPFFKKVSELGIPVEVHPTIQKDIWGGEEFFMHSSVSREYEIIKALVEVLWGVLPEFPDLRFLFAHYGGGVPFLLGRIMSWYFPGDADIPEEKIGVPMTIREFEDRGLKKRFYELFDRIYFDMAGTGGWMPAVKQALLVLKPQRLCFAADYPWEMGRTSDLKAYIAGIKGLKIPDKDKADMLGQTLIRLFRV